MPAPGWLRPSLQLLTETVDVDTDLTDTLASTVMWRWTVYTTIDAEAEEDRDLASA